MNAHQEYLHLCAWCLPVSGKTHLGSTVKASHGICQRHLAEQMARLRAPAATPRG